MTVRRKKTKSCPARFNRDEDGSGGIDLYKVQRLLDIIADSDAALRPSLF